MTPFHAMNNDQKWWWWLKKLTTREGLWSSLRPRLFSVMVANRRLLSSEGYMHEFREVSSGGGWPRMALHGGVACDFSWPKLTEISKWQGEFRANVVVSTRILPN